MTAIPRRAARRDLSEPEIVAAFEAAGAEVTAISQGNVPDLVVGFLGRNHWVECKTDSEPLSAGQAIWHDWWGAAGERPVVVRNAAQARKWITVWTREFAAACRARPCLDDDLGSVALVRPSKTDGEPG